MQTTNLSEEEQLRQVGVRPTRQRLAVLGVLRCAGVTYLTADQTARLSQHLRPTPRLATIYNVLNEFAKAGLVRRIDMGEKTVFCLYPERSMHFLDSLTGRLLDTPASPATLLIAPDAPTGWRIDGMDLFVRVTPSSSHAHA